MQRISNLVFHILWKLRAQILKIKKIKQKDRYWRLFPCPLYALFQMECFLPKMLQKYSLSQIRILYSSWNCAYRTKMGENQQRVVWKKKKKHEPCIFGIMTPSWLSKILLRFCNMVCHILCEFCGNFYEKWTRLTR